MMSIELFILYMRRNAAASPGSVALPHPVEHIVNKRSVVLNTTSSVRGPENYLELGNSKQSTPTHANHHTLSCSS